MTWLFAAVGDVRGSMGPQGWMIGCGVAAAGGILLAAVRRTLYQWAMPLATRDLTVALSTMSDTAGLTGAAFMVICCAAPLRSPGESGGSTTAGRPTERYLRSVTMRTGARAASSWPNLPVVARQVLLEVLIHGAMPRAEIATRLNLSRPTLTRATRALVLDGLLVERGTELRSSLGRPSEMLHVRGEAHHFLGVKLTADWLYAARTDLTATVVETTDEPLRANDPHEVVAQIAGVAARFPDVTGLGVTLGGTVLDGLVASCEFLHWTDVPLKALVTRATGIPTAVDNDVQALTAAEHWFGAGAGLSSMAVITVGAGVGTGLIVDGGLVEGAHGRPPRFGHVLVDSTGPLCGCGRRGCVASYLETDLMLRQLEGPPTYEEALERVRQGDRAARRVFDDAGYALGVLIGTVANAVDPQKVLLTGDGLPLYEVSSQRVHNGIEDTCEDDPDLIDLDVQPFDFGEWARSGAALAIKTTIIGVL